MTRVAINLFGRIGRLFLRAAIERGAPFDVVVVNGVNDPDMLAYLLEFDTVHGRLPPTVTGTADTLRVGDRPTVGELRHRRAPAVLHVLGP